MDALCARFKNKNILRSTLAAPIPSRPGAVPASRSDILHPRRCVAVHVANAQSLRLALRLSQAEHGLALRDGLLGDDREGGQQEREEQQQQRRGKHRDCLFVVVFSIASGVDQNDY